MKTTRLCLAPNFKYIDTIVYEELLFFIKWKILHVISLKAKYLKVLKSNKFKEIVILFYRINIIKLS